MGSNVTKTRKGNTIKFESQPFQEGAVRYAIKGYVTSGPDKYDDVVIKAFKTKQIRRKFVKAHAELDIYKVARIYVDSFNKQLKKYSSYDIELTAPDLVKIESLSLSDWIFSDYFDSGDYIFVQKYLDGRYVKWTNNYGYINKREDQEVMDILSCFQHYSYVKSGGRGICCDLQGIQNNLTIHLTDPAINSIDQKYGMTDIGARGIKETIGRHKCNWLCKKISLKNPQFNPNLRPVRDSTSVRLTTFCEV